MKDPRTGPALTACLLAACLGSLAGPGGAETAVLATVVALRCAGWHLPVRFCRLLTGAAWAAGAALAGLPLALVASAGIGALLAPAGWLLLPIRELRPLVEQVARLADGAPYPAEVVAFLAALGEPTHTEDLAAVPPAVAENASVHTELPNQAHVAWLAAGSVGQQPAIYLLLLKYVITRKSK